MAASHITEVVKVGLGVMMEEKNTSVTPLTRRTKKETDISSITCVKVYSLFINSLC